MSETFIAKLEMRVVGKSIEWDVTGLKDMALDTYIDLKIDDFFAFAMDVKELAEEVWPGIEPKEATSYASDYDEYYDKKLDNNGSLKLNFNESILRVSQVAYYESRVYKFNKRKMQSFLFDLEKEVTE